MSAAAQVRRRRVRRAAPVAVPLRPEREWEPIYYPGGLYVARQVPAPELMLGDRAGFDEAVVVLFTHDYALAARTAWPMWADEHGGRLSRPVRRWWRRVPVGVAGHEFLWWPARPGTPGAVPLVEFPFPPAGGEGW